MLGQMDPNAEPPRVFLSYSWTSQEHQNKVISLAERLAGDGVHVFLDVWDLTAGQDKYAFMEKMVTDATVKHVLLMCDRRYAEKADARAGGVGTETSIVSKEVYAKTDQKKFVPVIMERNEMGEVYTPTYISSRLYVDFSDEGKFAEEYERLLRIIFDRPAQKRPAIGTPPAFLTATDAMSPHTHLLRQRQSPVMSGAAARKWSPGRMKVSLLTDLRAQRFITPPTGEIDEAILSKIQELKGLRDATIEWFREVLETPSDEEASALLTSFFEELITIKGWPEELSSWSDWYGDHLAFFAREVWLYGIAVVIESRRWGVAGRLLNTTLCATINRQFEPVGYGALDCYLKSLEQVYNAKKQPKRLSVLADLVKERADDKSISFKHLMQADCILGLRGVVGSGDLNTPRWFPRTLVYASHGAEPFPLFVRWRAGQEIAGLQALLPVQSRADIYERLVKAGVDRVQRLSFDYHPLNFIVLGDLRDIEAVSRSKQG
jgi:hypothetical protein